MKGGFFFLGRARVHPTHNCHPGTRCRDDMCKTDGPARAMPASAVVSSLPSRFRFRCSKMSPLPAAVRQTPARKECPCSLPLCTRHKRVTIVRAARRYKACSLGASRLRSGHRGQWVLLASPTTSYGDKFGAHPPPLIKITEHYHRVMTIDGIVVIEPQRS